MNSPQFFLANPMDSFQANLGFVERQTSHIESEVYRTRYPELDYASLVPVVTEAHPFAKSVTYYDIDGTGKAGWINGNAKDIPVVGTMLGQSETAIHMGGIGYDYGWEEVNQAAMMGMNLASEKAYYANRAYQEHMYNIALTGDTQKGFEGLFNYTGVSSASVAADGTGSSTLWSTKTGDQIVRDFNAGLIGIHSSTNTVEMADTVLMPHERFQFLATTRLGSVSDTTLLEFIQKTNVYTAQTRRQLDIRGVRGLLTAGAGNTARMVTYRKSPQVLKMHLPMPHRFLPVQQDILRYVIPGVYRVGGLDIRLKGAVRYSDGI